MISESKNDRRFGLLPRFLVTLFVLAALAGLGTALASSADAQSNQAPRVTSVQMESAPLSGDTYGQAEKIKIRMTFNEEVVVAGNVLVGLYLGFTNGNYGDAWRGARYESGSGTSTLIFAYQVQEEDQDNQGIKIPHGSDREGFGGSGTIKSKSSGIERNQNYHATGGNRAPDSKVDGTQLASVIKTEVVSSPEIGRVYRRGEELRVEFTFNQEVEVEGVIIVPLHIGFTGNNQTGACGGPDM